MYREDPLQGKWCTPFPLGVETVVAIRGSSNDDGSNGPTHLQGCRDCSSQRQRNNFTGVGWGIGDEETPWDTFEGLSDHEEGEGVGLHIKPLGEIELTSM